MIEKPAGPLAATLRSTYLRYGVASVTALGFDFALFLAALATGDSAILSSAIGYGAGILVHWWLSSRAVFRDGLATRGRERRRQQALFLLSASIGLGVTMAVVAIGGWTGLDPRLAKVVAIAVAFQATYILRRQFVFA
jgi:putative flippase GtrA